MLGLMFVVAVGNIAALWGDEFLLGFMSLMRYRDSVSFSQVGGKSFALHDY
jgi:hypothetical protein